MSLRNFAIFPVLLISASALSAQDSGSVIQCDWRFTETSQQLSEIFKISRSSWQVWNAQDWKWVDHACATPEYFGEDGSTPPCAMDVSDDAYIWRQDATRRERITASYSKDFIFSSRTYIDRQTGSATFSMRDAVRGPSGSEMYAAFLSADGTCRKVSDPALKPKPAPKL